MGILNKMLSSVGIGAAKVDTIIHSELAPGGQLEATVRIKGGKVEQQIDSIYFSLHTNYERDEEDGDVHYCLDSLKLRDSFVVDPDEDIDIPVELDLPEDLPLTMGSTRVWLRTGLDISAAADPTDKDYLDIGPSPLVAAMFHNLHEMELTLDSVKCEEAEPGRFGRHPFIQEFEFKARSGPFAGRLEEFELFYRQHGDEVEVFCEIDRRARGVGGFFAHLLNRDESKLHFVYQSGDIAALGDQLYDLIDTHC